MTRHFRRCYLEITNICNGSCSFCPKTVRTGRMMTQDEYSFLLNRLTGFVDALCLHLMGEPFLHPSLPDFVSEGAARGFSMRLTSNGLLAKKGYRIVDTGALYKLSLSLHSFEDRDEAALSSYLSDCFDLADYAAAHGVITVLRLWNRGASVTHNALIDRLARERFGGDFSGVRDGYRIKERLFIEEQARFVWPGHADRSEEPLFCYGLRDQIGVLADGTVVPCCLDADGQIPLGNLFDHSLDQILSSPRAQRFYDGFSRRMPVEELCRTCGYARRFSR